MEETCKHEDPTNIERGDLLDVDEARRGTWSWDAECPHCGALLEARGSSEDDLEWEESGVYRFKDVPGGFL